jgi:dTDP-4-dehydrorhamnose reductase
MADPVFLILGKNGWIGGMLQEILTKQGKKYILCDSRTQDRAGFEKELLDNKITHVLNAAGVTGRPNVDWCEDNKIETVSTNVIGTLNAAEICNKHGVHHLLYATGCIFEYDDEHTIGGKGFTEEDVPNFGGSWYSYTKGALEPLLKIYPTTCVLRVRMPISDDLGPRNFVTKISKYDRVVNIPNSMTTMTDMLPVSIIMAERNLTGIYNFCNPGAISHNEVLELYKKHVDPDYTWENFTVEEQAKVIKAGRSNNTLDHTKLCAALPGVNIPEIHEAVAGVMIRMKQNLIASGEWPDNMPNKRVKK